MNFPSSKQTHYTLPPHFRYLLLGNFICTSTFLLLIIIINFNIILLIGFLVALPCILYVFWIAGFRRYIVSSEGLYVPNLLNPFQPTLITWHSIHKISSFGLASFQIQTSDNFPKPVFTSTVERFDQFIAAFHSRRIPIEAKQQQIPSVQSYDSDDGSLLSSFSSPKKIRTVSSVVIFLALFCFVIGCGMLAMGIWNMLAEVIFGLWICLIGAFIIGCSCVGIEQTLNGFVRIHYDGVEFPNFPAIRVMVHWSDLIYARIVYTPTKHGFMQHMRVYRRGDQDYLAAILVTRDAFHPLMRAFQDHNIPVLKETEEFKPTK